MGDYFLMWDDHGYGRYKLNTHIGAEQKEQYGMYWFQAKQVPFTKLSLSSRLFRFTYFGILAILSKCLFAELPNFGTSLSFKNESNMTFNLGSCFSHKNRK